MTPSIGRIVHYFAPRVDHLKDPVPGSLFNSFEVLPAIITAVHTQELVNLSILGGIEFGQEKTSVRFSDERINPPINTWTWPPRV